MEIVIIAIAVAIVAGIWYYTRNPKALDANKDGVVDLADIALASKAVAETVKAEVKEAAVEVKAEVKKTVAKAKASAKKAPAKAKATVKKATVRKPKSK